MTGEARAIGAVNTIYFDQKTQKITGANTDAYGFWQNLKTQHQAMNNLDREKSKILLIGAGGAARAVLYALTQQEFQNIKIVNRTHEKAQSLKAQFENKNTRITVLDWQDRHPQSDINLVVNTTSLGMENQKSLDVSLENCAPGTIIHDIVYAPLMTGLLRTAQKMELPYCTGLGMLIHQACPAFKRFFGLEPKIDETLQALIMRKTQK
jgi:shikimate dehydrogenase